MCVTPPSPLGAVALGRAEYQKLGCIYCHTQQVRPRELFAPGKGDIDARDFAPRHTVARDYVTQDRVFLGTMRTGPDLANIGNRKKAAFIKVKDADGKEVETNMVASSDWHMLHMYDPQLTSPGSNMAPFPFLYKKVVADTKPARALDLDEKYRAAHGIAPNEYIVPTERVDNLIAYLMTLKVEQSLPESPIKE